MIKVAYILTPIEFGGSEKVNLTFLRNVNRDRFDIYPILLVRPWEDDNIFCKYIKEYNYTISRIPVSKRPISDGKDYIRVARCILYLYRILSTGDFHLVHTHGYFSDIIAAPVCKYLRIPQLATCHGFISNDTSLKIYNWLDKFILRFCNKIIAVSSEIMNDLVKNGIDESKVVVIQNAIESHDEKNDFAQHRVERRRSLSINKDVFVIGYVGRLSEEKGIQYLIRAAAMLKEMGEKYKIIILGDGPQRGELIKLAVSEGLEKEIDFMGFQNEIEKWLPAFDLFVLPSLTEGTPMALLEAMSLGIPVVATSVGGVPMIVENGINGFLVGSGDHRGLSEKIMVLIKNPSLRERVAIEGVNTIKKRFDVKQWCSKIEGQYDKLIYNEL